MDAKFVQQFKKILISNCEDEDWKKTEPDQCYEDFIKKNIQPTFVDFGLINYKVFLTFFF